jgi:hypothetical protein
MRSVLWQGGRHERQFGRNQLICEPKLTNNWALSDHSGDNTRYFTSWLAVCELESVRIHALKQAKGDRAFAELLLVFRETGLEALDVACQLAQERGHLNTSIVLNELRRLTSPPLSA